MLKFSCGFMLLLISLYGTAQTKLQGKEYHVAQTGNDANMGTHSEPLKTIMAAAHRAMPGDVITIHEGVYRERITPPRGGNSDEERIVYRAAPGEKIIIKGSEVVKDWKLVREGVWETRVSNRLFGDFNPFADRIRGDWFWPTPKERKYHTGAVYLNGHWLMEAVNKEQVLANGDEKDQLWWAEVDTGTTTIWAQFKDINPNEETVEINVRQTVFYPDKPFINYLTVSGLTMEHAATNWAPPTAEQVGLIGTHWSRGWIIENNDVRYSKCVGITLGKYGDEHDNRMTESAEGYVGTINRALAFGWNKGTIGEHIVRNNTISHCEQAGIVGSLGCAFSTVEHNVIHDIHIKRLFTGAEMAGIKFHGAVDTKIAGNRIFRTDKAIWLDWMAQGAQVTNNLLYENDLDVFLEVTHGPTLLANNVMLSKTSLLMNAKGTAFVHNLFAGKMNVVSYDSRLTPYQKAHSTFVEALSDNPGGDIQFVNNLFIQGADVSDYSKAYLPVTLDGNVYTKGSVGISLDKSNQRMGEIHADAKERMKNYQIQAAVEKSALFDTGYVAIPVLENTANEIYLRLNLSGEWRRTKRNVVTSKTLRPALIPNLSFENTDGSALRIDLDYFGKKRSSSNPSPGPFEELGGHKKKVWP
ncbi:right-handed parallel beta-helix repeat-containing protein [Sphingobacterium lumbrici]|uniref:right-handed parallel beta-helix repeat-containing protein n=1 Tax=Sphingobacterium lumbrici TaxID=2559600 RepID=UPI001128EC85|nr:right-handed parallel beta-helix repeat-containing protein [Sphingobacterium lumbrici]